MLATTLSTPLLTPPSQLKGTPQPQPKPPKTRLELVLAEGQVVTSTSPWSYQVWLSEQRVKLSAFMGTHLHPEKEFGLPEPQAIRFAELLYRQRHQFRQPPTGNGPEPYSSVWPTPCLRLNRHQILAQMRAVIWAVRSSACACPALPACECSAACKKAAKLWLIYLLMARGKCATRAQADKLGWSERNTRRYRDYLLDAVLQAALIGTDLEENKRVNWKRPNPAPVQPYPTLKAG